MAEPSGGKRSGFDTRPGRKRLPEVEAALQAETREELLAALASLGPRRTPLPPVDRLQLASRLTSFGTPLEPLRLACLRSFATETLRADLAFEAICAGFELSLHEAPYGSFLPEAEAGSDYERFAPQITWLALRMEDLAPAWKDGAWFADEEQAARAIHEGTKLVEGIVRRLRERAEGLFVVSLLPSLDPPVLGFADATHVVPEGLARQRLLHALASALADVPDVALDDLSELVREHGRARVFDERLWHTSRAPFGREGGQLVARRLFGFVARRLTTPVKCLVLDADNTLWGGIVGEDGREGIALGPQHPGSAFVAWQRRLLAFRERGLLLAICSKNDEASVLDVLDQHPHQVLRRDHVAAWRINWNPKPDNLRELAAELNLGLDSFLFVDDSPHECHAVRTALPEVAVRQAPANPLALVRLLDDEPRLEVFRRTDEDARRATMYAAEAQRRDVAANASSTEDYLRSLAMRMTFLEDAREHLPRIAQLTQKTNQFNLTTRRYTEAEIEAAMGAEDAWVWAFSLQDAFGDSGLVGVCVGRQAGPDVLDLEAFLMSCRVIGRRAEEAFLARILLRAAALGVSRVRGHFAPTERNGLVADFWPRNGFADAGEGRYDKALGTADELQALLEELPIELEPA